MTLIYFFRPLKARKNLVEQLDETIPQFLELKEKPSNPAQEIKSCIPRQLRKPWKLLHKANAGSPEEHFNAVRELSAAAQG